MIVLGIAVATMAMTLAGIYWALSARREGP
jgi:hypothetical protein